MSNVDVRCELIEILNNFNADLYTSSLAFWNLLGYKSTRYFTENTISPDGLDQELGIDIDKTKFNKDKACVDKWHCIALLFQYHKIDLSPEIQREIDFVKEEFDIKLFQSYVFMSIELKPRINVTKTDYINITREVNKLLPMPVILLFRQSDNLTISIIDRRFSKDRKKSKVLQKVSLIKNVNIKQPHRGHLEILNKLHLKNLEVKNIKDLHQAWRKQLSIKELNIEFYKQVIIWYKSAFDEVQLKFKPGIDDKDQIETKKHFLVKLLCRLMFCWFIKEKGLINKEILELTNDIGKKYQFLKDPDNPDSNSYYRGILKPLFFDCLNEPQKTRQINKACKFLNYLKPDFDLEIFNSIPYLNGGIFDRDDEFLEDFYRLSDIISDKDVRIPNLIFYGGKKTDTKTQKEIEILGLNQLLNSYKFTIEENTPLEEDVALDPEMLGMVLENLLAELDPDEKVAKNARKNMGAYYTPREVIDYMVNDSLVLYLETKAKEHKKLKFKDQIKFLVYWELTNDNDAEFEEFVVEALDKLRILDPACGSGAFPMGMLHKITRILYLVDNDNSKWIRLKLDKVESGYKKDFEKHLKEHYDNYARKIYILRDSIFGIDLLPLAAHIAKLRFFISLIVEQKTDCKKQNCGVTPLPNLETNIICANSLNDLKPDLDIFEREVFKDLNKAINDYYEHDHTKDEKNELANKVAEDLSKSFHQFRWKNEKEKAERTKAYWKRWFQYGNIACPFFHFECFFPRIAKEKGFDIVIGNPPYGGDGIDEELEKELKIGSKDPYGAFIARFMNYNTEETPLKAGGILSFIVSDTFMTIKSHKELRKQLLLNYIHKMVRVHPDTFKQVVNTAIILCQKARQDEKTPKEHQCLMVDMTNISIHKDLDKFIDILTDVKDAEKTTNMSNDVYAIYKYKQNIIHKCSLLPLFVAPEKLFVFMQDSFVERSKTNPTERIVKLNGKELLVNKLVDIANVTQGLATGDNKCYLFQTPESGSTYRNIYNYKQFVVTHDELNKISNNEAIRTKIIDLGFHKDKKERPFDKDRWFEGRYIVPYDKGGACDTEIGWLPNYYVPTDYFIDWSSSAVYRMKTLTICKRDGKGSDSICSRFQNSETYFLDGISFSITGIYAPTFRFSSNAIYDVKGSLIIPNNSDQISTLIGFLSSKIVKMLSKAFIYHTVDMQVDAIKEIPIVRTNDKRIEQLVEAIIEKQKANPMYDYMNIEQLEIDKIVFELYGLNADDIKEVENWYARRYPRLVKTNAVLDNQESL